MISDFLHEMEDRLDVGVTWISEPKYQEMVGHPISTIQVADEHNEQGTVAAALVKNASNRDMAEAWLAFVQSPAGGSILQEYGMAVPERRQ